MKSENLSQICIFANINNSSSLFEQIISQPAFKYLQESSCPDEIKLSFRKIVDDVCYVWGQKIPKQQKRWLSMALNNSRSYENTKTKLAAIEKTLSECGYQKVRDRRLEAIKKLGISYGYIYVLSNKFMDKIVKIGMTESIDRSGDDRARELSTTGVPGKFCVEFQTITFNSIDAEDKILSKFEEYLKSKDFGERAHSTTNRKQELFLIKSKNYISIAVSYVQRELKRHEKAILDMIDLEVERERKIVDVLHNVDMKIQNGFSNEELSSLIDDLKNKLQYLKKRRKLNELFTSISPSGIAFYKSVYHCVEWLDFLLKFNKDGDVSPKLRDHISISIKNSISLLPKTLPNMPLQ